VYSFDDNDESDFSESQDSYIPGKISSESGLDDPPDDEVECHG
jgi:hypothetical protein